jgi:hypothetical protein
MTLPADVRQYPEAIALGLSRLRLVDVNRHNSVLLGAHDCSKACRLCREHQSENNVYVSLDVCANREIPTARGGDALRFLKGAASEKESGLPSSLECGPERNHHRNPGAQTCRAYRKISSSKTPVNRRVLQIPAQSPLIAGIFHVRCTVAVVL